jgi:hypothetical protein
MSSVAIRDIVTSVASTLIKVGIDVRVQNTEEITESIPQTPLIQVYAEKGRTDSGGSTDRASFGAKVRRRAITIHIDIYGRQRSMIGQDLAVAMDTLDLAIDQMEQEKQAPFFGNPFIREMSWSWERVVFEYGESTTQYSGFRIIIEVKVY